ncbi:MAG: NAD(P)-binding domain-containing protein, partial [Planctomycetaceae bacterium]
MAQHDIGLVGLAVMGQNLVLNMANNGYSVGVYNRTTRTTDSFVGETTESQDVTGYHSLKDLVLTDHHLGLLQTCALNVSRDQALTLTLVGAPGCGKTSAAHALANAAGRSILALRPESLT